MYWYIIGKRFVSISTIASWLFFATYGLVLAVNTSDLSQTINAGTLAVGIVDGSGNAVGSPSVTFGAAPFSFDTQVGTGTLGTGTQKIRVSNGTTTAAWSLTMAATSGNTTTWSDGSHTMDFNDSAANGRLTVDASGGTITPTNSYTTTGLTKGTSTAFAQGVTDSITLLTAGGTADKPGRWDFTGVALSQDIPATQAPGTYTINMTLTAS